MHTNLHIRRVIPAGLVLALALTGASHAVDIHNADEFDPWPWPADTNRDLVVDVSDLLDLLGQWGECPLPSPPGRGAGSEGGSNGSECADCPGDTNDDCVIDVADLLNVLSSWGEIDLTGTQYGLAWVYPETGPYDWDEWDGTAEDMVDVQTVLIATLGIHDPETGEWIEGNDGLLTGKYLETDTLTFGDHGAYDWNPVPPIDAPDHDFRVHPWGDEYDPAEPDRRKALIWSSEVHTYYHIDRYRREFLNEEFIDQLDLPEDKHLNLLHRQFNPELDLGGNGDPAVEKKPTLLNFETLQVFGFNLFPVSNIFRAPLLTRGPLDPYDELPPISLAMDPSALVGDYATLAAFWVLGDDEGWPSQSGFVSTDMWKTNVLPAVQDGLGAWTGYRYSGDEEVYNYASYATRMWLERFEGEGTDICHDNDTFDCEKGQLIRNVMMFDETQDHKNGLFPFAYLPEGYSKVVGPGGAEFSALYIAAVFYDISHEAGLGDHKADLLYWKTISLLDDNEEAPMRLFGQTIQQAARELWPTDGGDESVYEEDIRQVLLSRGIAVDAPLPGEPGGVSIGSADFTESLPEAVGPAHIAEDRGFASRNPETHPYVNEYGVFHGWLDGYTEPDQDDEIEYVSYQFYKHSKYGPCDELRLTDGTFDPDTGEYNEDGSYLWLAGERELGNVVLFSPGNEIHWVRYRGRCENEAEGYYAEDVQPFGFRVIKSIPNGFSFEVERIGEAPGNERITYELSIVDPSLEMIGAAEYDWTFTEYDGVEVAESGETVTYAALRDEPFTIHIERTRNGNTDTLELRERGNDLDRPGPGPNGKPGQAFVFNGVEE